MVEEGSVWGLDFRCVAIAVDDQVQSLTMEVGGWYAVKGKVKDERTESLVVQLYHNYQHDRKWSGWRKL